MLRAIKDARSASVGVAAMAMMLGAGSAGTHAAESGAQQAAAPIKIAVFDFEVEDRSAAGDTGASPVETKYLTQATEEAKRALAASGRYSIVDAAGADLSAAQGQARQLPRACRRRHRAVKLGADQDMVGVVTKISTTEYTVTVQISDAHNGAIISSLSTGLRIGADYSWSASPGS